MTYYIQRYDPKTAHLETVSEAERLKDAKHDLAEYAFSDLAGSFFISSRACKQWRDES